MKTTKRQLFVSYAYQIISTDSDRCTDLDSPEMVAITEEVARKLAAQQTTEGHNEYFLHNCSDLRP